MQGIVLLGFRRFVREGYGDSLWRRAQEKTGNGGRIYLPVQTYAYHELIQLVDAVADATESSPHRLLEDFGAFLAPDLLRMYATLLDPRWKLTDILTNSDRIVQRVAELKNNVPSMPVLRSTKTSSRSVAIVFTSRQRLCAMVRGVITGIAGHLGEPATIRESSCMLLGQRQCEISVTSDGTGNELGKRRTFPPPGAVAQRLAMQASTLPALAYSSARANERTR